MTDYVVVSTNARVDWVATVNGQQYIWQPKEKKLHCEGQEDRDCASVHEAEDLIREETGYTGNIFWY